MKVLITQPTYLPWIGYFDLLDWADLWISLDNVQFIRRSFHLRNKIVSPLLNTSWLTAAIEKCPRETNLNLVKINKEGWWNDHINKINSYYYHAKHFKDNKTFIENLLKPEPDVQYLSQLNTQIIKELAGHIGIKIKTIFSSEILPELSGTAEEKILQICDIIKPDEYVNFQGGVDAGLYTPAHFADKNIKFFKQEYIHPAYNQISKTFTPYMSIIDLILNEGPKAKEILISGRNLKLLN